MNSNLTVFESHQIHRFYDEVTETKKVVSR